jgi:hypothetical protein
MIMSYRKQKAAEALAVANKAENKSEDDEEEKLPQWVKDDALAKFGGLEGEYNEMGKSRCIHVLNDSSSDSIWFHDLIHYCFPSGSILCVVE